MKKLLILTSILIFLFSNANAYEITNDYKNIIAIFDSYGSSVFKVGSRDVNVSTERIIAPKINSLYAPHNRRYFSTIDDYSELLAIYSSNVFPENHAFILPNYSFGAFQVESKFQGLESAPVPEPSTFIMLGVGLLSLGIFLRRKERA